MSSLQFHCERKCISCLVTLVELHSSRTGFHVLKMICRLCLSDLIAENAIMLYDSSGNVAETQLIKIIAKYLHLELMLDDAVSTCICQDCCEHLEDFHRYWLLVDQKQSSLRNNEFLEVKCDVHTPSESIIGEEEFCENNIEPLLDFKNVLLESPGTPSNEHSVSASGALQDEDETGAAFEASTSVEARLGGSSNEDAAEGAETDSSDDDTPLQSLLNKVKGKRLTHATRKGTTNKRIQKTRRRARVKGKQKEGSTAATAPQRKPTTDKLNITKKNAEIISNFMELFCELCNTRAEDYTDLRKHFNAVHQRNPYVRCCNAVYDKPNKLVDHINWHQNPDMFKCDICYKQLRTKKCLQVHKDGKHGIKDGALLCCHICQKKFLSRKCMENHIRRHGEDDDKPHTCHMCEKSFLTAQRLRRHIESIHENIYPHICDTCGKKFKFKPSFERHLQEHQGIVEPPEQCQECGKWLKNKNALRLHRFNHDNVNVECNICGRICPSRTALRGHISYTHTLQKNLQCSYCEKSFKVAKNLQEHMAIHTGAQLYSCPHCAKECRSKSNMYVHIKRAHMQEWLKSKLARSNDPNFKGDELLDGGVADIVQHS